VVAFLQHWHKQPGNGLAIGDPLPEQLDKTVRHASLRVIISRAERKKQRAVKNQSMSVS
jgi:hypothetical protein